MATFTRKAWCVIQMGDPLTDLVRRAFGQKYERYDVQLTCYTATLTETPTAFIVTPDGTTWYSYLFPGQPKLKEAWDQFSLNEASPKEIKIVLLDTFELMLPGQRLKFIPLLNFKDTVKQLTDQGYHPTFKANSSMHEMLERASRAVEFLFRH